MRAKHGNGPGRGAAMMTTGAGEGGDDRAGRRGVGRIATLLGVLAAGAVLLTLADPGITIDEPLDVRPGRRYVATLLARGAGSLQPEVIVATYRDNAEHPPLGRWLLGVASTFGQPAEVLLRGGPDPTGTYVVTARAAPALAFGVLVGLVALAAGRVDGRAGAVAAGLALGLMPRVFAHAHLAALDTFIALGWAAALLAVVRATERPRPVAALALAGIVWGLALLTKIHAWFLPPVALAWALSRLPVGRALAGWSAWLGVGLATFVAGWPWLWADTWGRLATYLGTGVERASISVLYFGRVYADRDVPWHYPFVYFAATIPVGLLALAAWGTARGWADPARRARTRLWVGSILLFLFLFSTRVAVYDGERLFLVVFPFAAILAGQGFADLWARGTTARRRALLAFLAAQGVGVVWMHPFGLSYYNALVGGLPGAERLGLELTYWGDAVDDVLLDRLAVEARPGQAAALVPTLAPNQGKFATTRRLARLPLVVGDGEEATRADYLLVSRRSAYWSEAVRRRLATDRWVAVRSRQGVWLAALLARRAPSP